MPELQSALTELASVAADCLESAPSSAARASDHALLEMQRELANSARLLAAAAAALAAEITHRSRRELGHDGLAQRLGARTPEALVRTVTGSTSSDARRLVRIGTLVARNSGLFEGPAEPWLREVLTAAGDGRLSPDAVDAIRSGLGSPTEGVTPEALAAARGLVIQSYSVSIEELAIRARQARDDLDVAGVALREQELRDARWLRFNRRRDGMTTINGLLDPESAAIVLSAYDAATSPRRGGPRFVGSDEAARAERILHDERTTEQLALDAFVELIDVAVRGASEHVLGAKRPAVRLLVTKNDLDSGVGAGHIEGQSTAVSIGTVERQACDGGVIPILFDDDGQALNLGRAQRLHSSRQRTAIAARDGGCTVPGCDRPPSWCEVHHIVPWSEGGSTDLADGVLLCRHHHMLLHNNDWRIGRSGSEYWMYPPPEIAKPFRLQTKSATLRRLRRAA